MKYLELFTCVYLFIYVFLDIHGSIKTVTAQQFIVTLHFSRQLIITSKFTMTTYIHRYIHFNTIYNQEIKRRRTLLIKEKYLKDIIFINFKNYF
jgi:tmRNA-binding protein